MSRSTAVASLLFLLGCSAPKVDFAPLRPGVCAEEQVPCDDGHAWVEVTRDFEPRTLVYVIDTLSIPAVDAEGRVAGFDLDGMDSGAGTDAPEASCGEARADFVSSVDPNVRGVDNQVQMLVPVLDDYFDPADCPSGDCENAAMQSAIDEGRMLFLLEVADLESWVADDHVEVTLYEGDRAPDDPLLHGEDGRIASGQAFTGRLIGSGVGTILSGRLAWSLSRLPLALFIPDPSPFELRDVQLRADVAEEGLTRGALGGKSPLPHPTDVPFCDAPVVFSYVDTSLDDETCCGPPGACCNAVSAGLTFAATRAERRP